MADLIGIRVFKVKSKEETEKNLLSDTKNDGHGDNHGIIELNVQN